MHLLHSQGERRRASSDLSAITLTNETGSARLRQSYLGEGLRDHVNGRSEDKVGTAPSRIGECRRPLRPRPRQKDPTAVSVCFWSSATKRSPIPSISLSATVAISAG